MLALSKWFGNRLALPAMLLATALAVVGCAGSGSSNSSGNATATPTFAPGAGTYNTSQTVTIADGTPGAVLYCTTDGTTPTTSAPRCSQPITIAKTEFLQAIAVAPNMAPSAVASAGYTINLNAAATPTFSPDGGNFIGSQQVAISDTTPGANVYYTLDGSAPGPNATLYTGPVNITKSATLSAIALATGYVNSGVHSTSFIIQAAPYAPVINPAGGTFTSIQSVAITDATPNVTIYYTTDGSAPSISSPIYAGPISVSSTETVSAIAVFNGLNSLITTANFTINLPVAATPTFSPVAGTYTTTQQVSISDATSGASIYYTLDGSTPTTSSAKYSGAINVTSSETIKAIATAANYTPSAVATAAYVINLTPAAVPTFNPPAGTYTSAQQVTLSDTTSGATMYYTLDGSTPTTNSTPYTGTPINVASSMTIKAIAAGSQLVQSAVASAAYTINLSIPAPTVSPSAGSYTTAQTVTLSDTDTNATIYYTVDGTTPTSSSTKYSGPISVGSSETIKAIAVDNGVSSAVTTAAYTINLGPSYSGKVMSGTLPVVGATVKMYAAGNTGYASSATVLTANSATTASDGSFTLNYNCPAAGGDLVYLIATGGHTGSNTASNAGLAFMAALGSCNGTLPTPLVMNEVTTVASAYALSPFMSGAANVGSSAANYEQGTNAAPGLANAFATVNSLVDLTTGEGRDHTPDYPTNLAGDTNLVNNSNVPHARINALANMLNACAAGSGCSSLFSAATPSSGTAPSDTLQAILSVAQHPGSNATMLYNLTAGSGPFTPALTAAPGDWTLAITYTGGGLGFAPDLQLPTIDPAMTFSDGRLLNTALAIDATGDIWITGSNVSRSNVLSLNALYTPYVDLDHGMVAKFNNQGKPLTPASSYAAGAVSFGGYIPRGGTQGNGGTVNAESIAIDPSGNAWVFGGSQYLSPNGPALTQISPGLSLTVPYASAVASGNTNTPYPTPMTIDALGDIWVFGNGLIEFDSTGKKISSDIGYNPPASPYGYGNMESLVFDSTGSSLWSSDFSYGDLFQINPATNTATFDYFASTPGVFTPLAAGSTLSGGAPGNIYGCPSNSQSLSVFNVSSTSIPASHPIPTGRGCGNWMVADGAGHLFAITGSKGSSITPGVIDELSVSSSGVSVVSSAAGYTGTSSGEAPAINGDPTAPANYAVAFLGSLPSGAGLSGAAIDGSGNLWVLNKDTGTDASKGNALVKFVGIAAPVVTPTSLALQNNQVGVRP